MKMKKLLAFLLLTLALLPACAAPPEDDGGVEAHRAAQTFFFHSPYGRNVGVDAYIGIWQLTGTPHVLYARWSDGYCSFSQINPGPSLTTNAMIYLSDQNDRVRLIAGGTGGYSVFCTGGAATGWQTILSMPQDRASVEVYGMGGNDIFSCNGPPSPANKCFGDTGNDFMATSTGNVFMYGGSGDDKLVSDSRGGSLFMFGEDGDDCLSVPAGSGLPAAAYDCGTGSRDTSVGSFGAGCEGQVSTCLGD
jgi:hypothetical protein